MMRIGWIALFVIVTVVLQPGWAKAQTLWDRRNYSTATMFHDYRARNIGDVLTVFIDENTGFDAQEKRAMDKKTNAEVTANGTGSTSNLGGVLRSFGYALDLS